MKKNKRRKSNQQKKKWIRKLARIKSRRDSSALLPGSTTNREPEPHPETVAHQKRNRIWRLFYSNAQPLSKRMIMARCTDIGISTVEAILSRLLKEGRIIKENAGRNTVYARKLDLD